MTTNLATWDRTLRVVAAVGLVLAAAVAPLPLGLRLAGLLAPAVYMLGTALSGTCLGYRLLGLSTCPRRNLS